MSAIPQLQRALDSRRALLRVAIADGAGKSAIVRTAREDLAAAWASRLASQIAEIEGELAAERAVIARGAEVARARRAARTTE